MSARDPFDSDPPPLPPPGRAAAVRLKGVPFALRGDERMLVRGGFGGTFAWVWVCTVLPFTLCCWSPLFLVEALRGGTAAKLLGIPISLLLLTTAAWPLLRSGRYWLTTRKLVWKPRLGSLVTLDLADARTDGIRAGLFGRALRVPGRPTVTVRYVRGIDRLWGGIALLADADDLKLSPVGAGVTDVAWWTAARRKGAGYQLGVAVLRPDYIAFLPTGESKNLAGEFLELTLGKAAREVVGRGDAAPETRPSPPFDVLLGFLSERPPAEFDEFLWDAVERYDGLWWDAGRATATREAIPARPSRLAVVFRRDAVTVRGLPALDQESAVGPLLDKWARGEPVPRRYPVLKTGLITALLLIVGGIFVYTGWAAQEPVVEVGEVSPADVTDRSVVPDGAFVTVTGHPDAARDRRLPPRKKNGPADVLVVLTEAPKLVLVVPEDHALSRALRETERLPKRKGAPPPNLDPAEWTVSGRVFDRAEAGGTSKVPAEPLREYVSRDLGADPAATRVLIVGVTPTQLRTSWYLPYGLAVLFGGSGVLLAGVILRALLVGRWDRYGAERARD
jgi:hypothetical protein